MIIRRRGFLSLPLPLPLLLVSLSAVVACSGVPLVSGFEPPPSGTEGPLVDALEIRIGPDARPFGGRSSVGGGFLAVIPLVPYGRQKMSPEFGIFAASLHKGDFPSEVGAVVTKDLRALGIAGWVGESSDRLPDEVGAETYYLELVLEEGIYERNMTLYGLSLAGALLWFVGLPNSYGSADLEMSVVLKSPAGETLGSKRFEASDGAVEWLYYNAVPVYTKAMVRAYSEISPDLRAFVSSTLAEARSSAGAR